MLMILDNCEHVLPPAASIVETLLQSCPDLRILAISREPLKAGGERAYCLRSLSVDDGCKLFADRARAVDHRFALTDERGYSCANMPAFGRKRVGNRARRSPSQRAFAQGACGESRKPSEHTRAGERTALARQQTMRGTIE